MSLGMRVVGIVQMQRPFEGACAWMDVAWVSDWRSGVFVLCCPDSPSALQNRTTTTRAEASFGLKVGELSEIVSTDSGVHIILRVA